MTSSASCPLTLALALLTACATSTTDDPYTDAPIESGDPTVDDTDRVVDEDCTTPDLDVAPLFATAVEVTPIVTVSPDGVLTTRGAGRVRGRHEYEASFGVYLPEYFQHRSFGFTVEDHVAAGESRVVVTYQPEVPASTYGPRTNFRVWQANGSVYHLNTEMADGTEPQQYVSVVTQVRPEGRPLQVGDLMTFEFGIFLAGMAPGDPGAVTGRHAYYSATFRYRVGEGGLEPTNTDRGGRLGPTPEAWSGGGTTVPHLQVEPEMAFSQMALAMQPDHVQAFLRGRRLFHTDFGDGTHSEPGNPMLTGVSGLASATSLTPACSSCHVRNGRGPLEADGEALSRTVVKLYGESAFGPQLQPDEGLLTRSPGQQTVVTLADGTEVTLTMPAYDGADEAWGVSPRRPRPLLGLGLLEAVAEADILQRATDDPCEDLPGVNGRASLVTDPETGEVRLGRFGWKAEKVSLRHQLGDALLQDMGVTSAVFPEDAAELDEARFADLLTYASLLGVPGRRDETLPQVVDGQELFTSLGCVACHVPDLLTGSTHPFVELRDQAIQPYTDLLLHDMGEGLADPSGSPLAREWRTPPLWGLGMTQAVDGAQRFLHDGRAGGVLEAILWHGGEAAPARDRVVALDAEDRAALLAFLGSL